MRKILFIAISTVLFLNISIAEESAKHEQLVNILTNVVAEANLSPRGIDDNDYSKLLRTIDELPDITTRIGVNPGGGGVGAGAEGSYDLFFDRKYICFKEDAFNIINTSRLYSSLNREDFWNELYSAGLQNCLIISGQEHSSLINEEKNYRKESSVIQLFSFKNVLVKTLFHSEYFKKESLLERMMN